MEKIKHGIEEYPFFKSHGREEGEAVIDIQRFREWLYGPDFEHMDEEDEADRLAAMDEDRKGESLDLKEAVKGW